MNCELYLFLITMNEIGDNDDDHVPENSNNLKWRLERDMQNTLKLLKVSL